MCIGLLISVPSFVILGGGDLLDQWLAGYGSIWFILGTLLINAGTCLGIFGIIAAIGLVVSISVKPPRHTSVSDTGAVA
jgi:hypothetical protein